MSDEGQKPDENQSEWSFDDASAEGKKGVGDTLKRLLTVGISAAFMTEESIRTYLGEMKLPKEALSLLLQGAKKSKEELMGRVGNEIVAIIHKIDFVEEASRFVENHKFRISAEVEVLKKTNSEKNADKNNDKETGIKVTLNKK